MTDQERNQVLKMIEEGKITPEEGLKLMQALDQSPAEDETTTGKPEAGPSSVLGADAGHRPPGRTPGRCEPAEGSGPAAGGEKPEERAGKSSFEADPRIARVKSTARRLWQIPLWIGVGITVLSAVGMYFIMRGPGMNFWFYFMILPLLLGVAIVVVAVGTRKARWIFVDIHQKPGEKPQHIFLGFPLPLKLTAWFLRTFGNKIDNLKNTNVDEVIQLIEAGFSGDALVVNVDEGEDDERVQVYIG